LSADADLLETGERAEIDSLLAALEEAKSATDAKTVEAATDRVAKGTEAFAAMRMNRGIQKALSGQNIENI
jgi:molecular chaperone HscA